MKRFWAAEAQAALLAAAALLASAAPAAAVDCSFGDCIDVATLPPSGGSDIAEITQRAQAFYGVDARVYIVSSAEKNAYLPYMLPEQPPFVLKDQVHIPEIYHASIEFTHLGEDHFVWHYIVGHEMAHVYQERIDLIEAMSAPFQSVVLAELHADCLAGFFMASEYGLSVAAIDQLLREQRALPTGRRGDATYHGEPGERFFITTQGALQAFSGARPTLPQASAQCVRCAFDILAQSSPDGGAICQ